MQSRSDSVKTPAGRFGSCLRFYFDIPWAIDDEFTDWLAPEVGLVFRCAQVPWELKEATVNGIRYPPVTSVYEQPPTATSQFELSQNYPNPFNPSTVISYEVRSSARVELQVLDLLGREVRLLVDRFVRPGTYKTTWDGRDTRGRIVTSGVYVYRLSVDDAHVTRKLVFIK
jgi:hypothetical protein